LENMMSRWMKEPEKRLPVSASCDLVVVGGGIAGVSAVLAAVRCGASVALVEKACALGGLATLGNVVLYLPLCDGMGHQIIRGLGEELLKASINDMPERFPDCWTRGGDKRQRLRQRYMTTFNPASFMLALEELVVQSGADLHYDTRFCDVIKCGDRIDGVIVENKSGRSVIACKAVVDASGDADVCARAGEATYSHLTDTRSAWFLYSSDREHIGLSKLSVYSNEERARLDKLSIPYDKTENIAPEDTTKYSGGNAHDVTRYIVESNVLIRQKLKQLQRASCHGSIYPLLIPTLANFRTTRRLKGVIELKEEDEVRSFSDSIGMTGSWWKSGPVYTIPFRALFGSKVPNLITAGRCISSSGTAWDITRAIPACAVTGQAAGVAASLISSMEVPCFAHLDILVLQEHLRKQKVLLSTIVKDIAV
jgi:ribulose 1,5-bisphosphate synthetase/thiazole synthase